MTRRAVRRESGAGTTILAVVTAVVALAAILAAAFAGWYVLSH